MRLKINDKNFINAVKINDAPSDRNIKRQFNEVVSVLWQLLIKTTDRNIIESLFVYAIVSIV